MQVNCTSNFNFKAYNNGEKKRFITPTAQKDAQKLLRAMNQQTTYSLNKDETEYFSNILKSLNSSERYKFTDERFYIKPVDKPQEHSCDCTVKMGKTILNINSSNGEIVGYKKFFFMPWSMVYERAEKVIKAFLENFNNPEAVQKNFLPIRNYTEKGRKLAIMNYYKIK